MADVFERLTALFAEHQAAFRVIAHEPVFTSEQAASVRGTPLGSGAKALICRADDRCVMFVLPADRRLASNLIRKHLGLRSLRFASREEVQQLTGLAPGAIPPFGSLFHISTLCDEGLRAHPQINFNAGDHARSVSMPLDDYLRIERPEMGIFAE